MASRPRRAASLRRETIMSDKPPSSYDFVPLPDDLPYGEPLMTKEAVLTAK